MKKILPILKKVAMGIGIASFLFILYAVFIAEDTTEMVQNNEQIVAGSEDITESWEELEERYFAEANEKGWPALVITNSQGEEREYEKKNNQWVRKGENSQINTKISTSNSLTTEEYKKILGHKIALGAAGINDITRKSDGITEIIKNRNSDLEDLISKNKSTLSNTSWQSFEVYLSSFNDFLKSEVDYSKKVIGILVNIKEVSEPLMEPLDNELQWLVDLKSMSKAEFEKESKSLDTFNSNIDKIRSQQSKIILDFNTTIDKWSENHQDMLAQIEKALDYSYQNSNPSQYSFSSPRLIPPPTILPLSVTTHCSFSMNPVGGGGNVHCSSY